jgi:hypothetical protein
MLPVFYFIGLNKTPGQTSLFTSTQYQEGRDLFQNFAQELLLEQLHSVLPSV